MKRSKTFEVFEVFAVQFLSLTYVVVYKFDPTGLVQTICFNFGMRIKDPAAATGRCYAWTAMTRGNTIRL